MDSQLALLAALTEGWTDKQREIVWMIEAHQGYQKDVAKLLGIPPSVVSKQRKAAKYDAYHDAWKGLTDYLINMDEYAIENKPVALKSYVSYISAALYRISRHNYAEALPLLLKSLDLAKQDLGEDDPLLAQIYNNLAETYTKNKQYDKAEEAITESLRLQEPLPKARLHYAETILIKAWIHFFSRELEETERSYESALKVARDILIDRHPFFEKIAAIKESLLAYDVIIDGGEL
jgi:tetratricopeptide (TPR) repeat protein